MPHSVLTKDSQPVLTKVKRQDWCRWPICKDFYKNGVCPYEENAEKGESLCSMAHVREEDGVSETADGFVRICFDSMGLIQVCEVYLLNFQPSHSHVNSLIATVPFRIPTEKGIIVGSCWLSSTVALVL